MKFENNHRSNPPINGLINHDRDRVEHPILQHVHAEAVRTLGDGAIQPMDFIDLYGEKNVLKDLNDVRKAKEGFQTNGPKMAAEILEAILYEHTELSNWLGPNAETIRTSEYDDIMNHVDLIVEFNDDESTKHLALGADVSFGTQSMQRKFERIKSEIDKDKLANVKYFESHGYKGSLRQLPRIVIGVELDKVIQLAGYWERNDKKAFVDHITKDIIMKEIESQLMTFLTYARSIDAKNAIKSYERAFKTIKSIHTVENGFLDSPVKKDAINEDRVYQSILKNLEAFRTTSRQH